VKQLDGISYRASNLVLNSKESLFRRGGRGGGGRGGGGRGGGRGSGSGGGSGARGSIRLPVR
jgi:hypothetical protein